MKHRQVNGEARAALQVLLVVVLFLVAACCGVCTAVWAVYETQPDSLTHTRVRK